MAVSLIDLVPPPKRPGDAPCIYVPWFNSKVTGVVDPGPPRMASVHDPAPRLVRQPVATFLDYLDRWGIKDPTGASHHWATYLKLKAIRPKATPPAPSISPADVAKIAAGKLDPNEAAVEDLDPDRAAREIKARRQAIAQAQTQAWNAGRLAVWEHHDDVHDLFATVMAECLADHKDRVLADKWAHTLSVLDTVRSAGLLPRAEGATAVEYVLARPDLARLWALRGASDARASYGRMLTPKETGTKSYLWLVQAIPTDGPDPLDLYEVGEHRDEWLPGPYTPAQVIEHAAVYEPDDPLDLIALHRSR